MSHMDPLRDRVMAAIGHQYEIEDEIGRGGMSVVYRARDVRLGRQVAVKVLPPELAYDPAVRLRFTHEAQTAARLSHPHIVPIYDVGERDGLAYLVMSFVTGGNLGTLLAREPRQPIDEVRRILAEVADALAHAHHFGIVHRDIKPDNVLLDQQSGRVLVTDFGIARAVEANVRLTMTGIAVGTPSYMSPEQATAEREIDGRSDIYALGVVGYQMLTGRLPFTAASSMAMLLKQVTERARPIDELRPDVPRSLQDAIERAMTKSPEDRWPNAGAMRDAIVHGDVAAPAWRSERRDPVRYHSPNPDDPRAQRTVRAGASGSGRAMSPARGSASVIPAPAAITTRLHDGAAVVLAPAYLATLTPAQLADLRLWNGRVQLYDRVKAMRGLAVLTLVTTVAGFGALGGVPDVPPLVLAPLVPMWMMRKVYLRGRSLRASGLRLRRVLLSPLARKVLPAPSSSAQRPEVRLAPMDAARAPYAAVIGRAGEDRAAILDILSRLPKDDRAMLPDIEPTANALVERVITLAKASARVDLPDQRAALERQLEDAALAIGNLRLDLTKLQASGLTSTLEDVTSATRAARAVARDIAAAIEAVAEVRKL